jgi:hypothetical protein
LRTKYGICNLKSILLLVCQKKTAQNKVTLQFENNKKQIIVQAITQCFNPFNI